MLKKRLLCLFLSMTVFVSVMPAISYAEDDLDTESDIESMQNEMNYSVPYTGIDVNATQAPFSHEATEYEYTVPDTFAEDDINDTECEVMLDPYGISLLATTTNNYDWERIFNDHFGDDYLAPYKKKEGTTVGGNTNRLIINETDLTLPGKNGLDLNIRRRYDNQQYNTYFVSKRDTTLGANEYNTISNRWYIYGFRNSSNNSIVYIGFPTHDDFYTYMENGFTVSALPSRTTRVKIREQYYYIYMFEQIYYKKSNSGITLTYDSSIEPMVKNINNVGNVKYTFEDKSILNDNNFIDKNWLLDIPESVIAQDARTINSSKTVLKYDFTGAFRNLDGNVYRYTGVGTFVINDTGNTYTSRYASLDNNFLDFIPYYETQYLSDDIAYNFIIKDNDKGLEYYFFNTGITDKGIKANQHLYIVAVKDKYDNMIRYQYNSDYSNLTSIIDTYGRTVNLTRSESGATISYTDDNNEQKVITYTNETLSPSSLDNDSRLKSKEVNRLTVTNAEGESTIYDSRATEVLHYACSTNSAHLYDVPSVEGGYMEYAKGNNIERIIYPTGAESRYKYRTVYFGDAANRVAHGAYSVEEAYDIIDGAIKNRRSYSYTAENTKLTKTTNDISKGSVNVREYKYTGLLTKSTMSATGTTASTPYTVTSYTYNVDDRQVTSVMVNNSGITTYTYYEYKKWYPNLLEYKYNSDEKTTYTYHVIDGRITGIPNIINHQYKSGSTYITDTQR